MFYVHLFIDFFFFFFLNTNIFHDIFQWITNAVCILYIGAGCEELNQNSSNGFEANESPVLSLFVLAKRVEL